MKQKLLAIAAALAALASGTVVFINYESGSIDRVLENIGNFEPLNKASCTMRACNAAQCIAAQNLLADGGSSCAPKFVACDFRIGPAMRNRAADAGVTLGPQKYQRLELVALQCPVAGGNTFGVPFTDAGWPVYAVTVATPTCVRAPLDGGLTCLRLGGQIDGGSRFIGTGNVFPAAQAAGSNCEPVACGVFFGDPPETSL